MIGVGIDLVDVQRFRSVLKRRKTISERLFTEGELTYCNTAADPTERLAVRFAAKEAVMKALGVGLGSIRFRDVEVIKNPSGQPAVMLHGSAAELASNSGVTALHLSLTHTTQTAEALVIAE